MDTRSAIVCRIDRVVLIWLSIRERLFNLNYSKVDGESHYETDPTQELSG